MRLKTVLGGALAAGGMLVAAPAGASANIMWCAGDPPQQVTSATGTQFVVNTQIYASGPQQRLNHAVSVSSSTRPDGAGGTLVTVVATGPSQAYITLVATYNPGKGTISARSSGTGTVVVVLDVPIS